MMTRMDGRKRSATSFPRVVESRENDATCLWLASEVGVATIRLRFGGGHGSRRRIGLQYRKSLANQLAPRYARNSAGTLVLSLSPTPSLSLPLSLSRSLVQCYRYLSCSISIYVQIGKIEKQRGGERERAREREREGERERERWSGQKYSRLDVAENVGRASFTSRQDLGSCGQIHW